MQGRGKKTTPYFMRVPPNPPAFVMKKTGGVKPAAPSIDNVGNLRGAATAAFAPLAVLSLLPQRPPLSNNLPLLKVIFPLRWGRPPSGAVLISFSSTPFFYRANLNLE